MCVLLCVFTACVLGEGVEMSSWLDGHSFILLFLNFIIMSWVKHINFNLHASAAGQLFLFFFHHS